MQGLVDILFVVCGLLMELVGWIICHMLCEFKYYWCKKDCRKCRNWRCKRFALKPITGNGYRACPSCKYVMVYFPDYCPSCGQRIDWSDYPWLGKELE